LEIIRPGEWPAIREAMPETESLLKPLIPAGVTTFVHGPPGSGKSAFVWGAMEAMQSGRASYLGLPVKPAACLLLCCDMNKYAFKERWANYDPSFAFAILQKCNIAKGFKGSKDYNQARELIAELGIGLVALDAVAGFMLGQSVRDDETATMFDAALAEWLPGVAKVVIGHDKKRRKGKDGHWEDPDFEDFNGSQLWLANVQSQIHITKLGDHHSLLQHGKCQVATKLAYDVGLYIDVTGQAELWQEKRAQDVIQKTNEAIRGMIDKPALEKVAHLMAVYNIAERTAWRWLSLARG